MKKKILSCFCLLCIYGCTIKGNETENKQTTTYITQDMKKHAQKGTFETLSTISLEPDALKSMASDIAIVRVLSVEHADMDFAFFAPMTYGSMIVEQSLVGDTVKGSVLSYAKPGGLVSIAEYESTDNPEAIAKRDALRKQAGIEINKEETYYDILLGNDVEIIPGNLYLAYFDYHKDKNLYEVIGLGNGFREIQFPSNGDTTHDSTLDIPSLQIRNNTTGELESLQQYINTYIN